MLSDVPVGSFLSGGIDSTLITALMQKITKIPVKSFSIGFQEDHYDESVFATEVANYLGTEHTNFIITETEALQAIPHILEIYDEPFADSSQIPTQILCSKAKKSVTVALTGDGADELFGGYNRYFLLPKYWKAISILPEWLKSRFLVLSNLVTLIGNEDSVFLQKTLSKLGLSVSLLNKLDRLGRIVSEGKSIADVHDRLTRLIEKSLARKLLSQELEFTENDEVLASIEGLTDSEQMMFLDSLTYLPGDSLTKVDRASMSVSLETRAPYLDRDVIEFAWHLRESDRLSFQKGKLILREILNRYVPSSLIERPKQGFSIYYNNTKLYRKLA